ncbi:NACHT, LRR and PYD domains-containing protein 1 homolog, partial [Engraulis encrasicolus]|uniref:NACHT, LRR and PYD domains-containing protein 1 homolog n=1 Tax=Engraulis encrasicolus TaxID=184585 RepID=UPI002FD21D21
MASEDGLNTEGGLSCPQGVSITGSQGGQVCAPVLLHTTVQGNVNISLSSSGGGACASSATASKDDIDVKSVMLDYKESILSRYETVEEYNSLPCEDVRLADRYTQLLMVQKHRPREKRVEEICTRGDAFHQVLLTRDAKDYESIRMENFFSPTDKGEAPRAVLLQGHSGMGKSFTAQKIMQDWASGRLYANSFEVVFHLKCKELNLSRGEQSLMDLLQLESVFVPAMHEVLNKYPQKVLFLVDGFDELRLPLDISSSLPTDAFTKAPVAAVLSALLQGKILSRSSLLVTCRSTVSDKLSKLLKRPQRFTEILGFSEEGVEEYFYKFFNDQKLSSQAFDTVRSNEHLFAACFVPIISWIVCTVFRERFGYEMELTTTTSVFVHFVSILLEHHCHGFSQPVPSLLRSLGQLAEKGILEQNVLFEEREVIDMVPDPVSVPFLCKFLVKKNVAKKTMFSFMHLSFQEFFTALLYATAEEEEGQSKVENLLQREARGDHHLLPVIYFLFGLSNKELGSTLTESVHLSISATLQTQLEKWIDQLNRKT